MNGASPSTTARLGFATLAVQAACLLAVVAIYLLEHFGPGSFEATVGATAQVAISTIGSIAVGGGIGGGLVTAGHGVRHYGTAAPTTAQLALENPPDPDADATVPS